MPDEGDSRSQVEMKQRSGRQYGEWRDEQLQRILADDETIELEEWYQLADKLFSRQETIQAFFEILDYAKDHPGRVLKPGKSRVFKRAFLSWASVDNKTLLLDKLRDPILYMEIVTAHRRPVTRRISSLEDAF